MKNKKTLVTAGILLVCIWIAALILFLAFGRKKEGAGEDPGQQAPAERDTGSAETGTTAGEEDDIRPVNVLDYDSIYYLLPEGKDEFVQRLTAFVREKNLDAGEAMVLTYHIDDREKAEEAAQFFLLLDDPGHTIVCVSFEKGSGSYDFGIFDPGGLPDGMQDGLQAEAGTEYVIPESYEDELMPGMPVRITDPEGELGGTADLPELERELEGFLSSIAEDRRNLYVSSFESGPDGYQAVLDFETSRADGRNLEVVCDDGYHFRLK